MMLRKNDEKNTYLYGTCAVGFGFYTGIIQN